MSEHLIMHTWSCHNNCNWAVQMEACWMSVDSDIHSNSAAGSAASCSSNMAHDLTPWVNSTERIKDHFPVV